LISQNSNILSPGSSLEIRAGVGYFSTKTSPEITINNKTIPLLDSGYALYKIKVPEKEGFYQFPVYTKFLNLNTGKIEIIKKDIKYTVQKNVIERAIPFKKIEPLRGSRGHREH